MSASQEEIDNLIIKAKALSWEDLQLESEDNVAKHYSKLTLVGKLLSSKPLNKNTFHATIKAVWSFVLGLTIEDVDTNIFLFIFPTQQDKDRVLANRPWNFKGFHMVLKNWPPGLSIHEVSFKTSIFWVQVHGLPMDMLTNQNAARIGNVLGRLMEVDRASIFGVTLRRYLHIRVDINIENPLPDGFDLNRPNRISKKILFKYERLSDFCYGCGHLGHVVQVCPLHAYVPVSSKYGPWMRAESSNFRSNPRQLQAMYQSEPMMASLLTLQPAAVGLAQVHNANFMNNDWNDSKKGSKRQYAEQKVHHTEANCTINQLKNVLSPVRIREPVTPPNSVWDRTDI